MTVRESLSMLAATLCVCFCSGANAQFPACGVVNSTLATGTDPLDFVRMAMRADGRPLLVFSSDVKNNASLYLFDCANAICSDGHVVYLDTSSNYFGAPGIAIRANGNPLILDSWFGGMRLYDCADADCASFNTVDIFPHGSALLSDMPMALQSSGNPVFLYLDGSTGARPGQLIAHFCTDATCTETGTEQVLAIPPPNFSEFAELALTIDAQDVPSATYLVSEGASNLYDYAITVCSGTPTCSTVTSTQISGPVSNSSPTRTALAVRSDRRPLALDNQANNMALLDCTTMPCTTATNRVLPAAVSGQVLGLKLLSGDVPAFALFGTSSVGAFACADATCTTGSAVQTSSAQMGILDGDFALDAAMHPAIAYIDFAVRNLAMAVCADAIFADGFE